MTKIITSLLFILIVFGSKAQKHIHTNEHQEIKKFLSTIKVEQDRQIQFNKSIELLSRRPSTTSHLIDICYFFPNDYFRYKLCLAAYPNIIDKNNFFKVYDVFSQFSFAIKLYHNTQMRTNFSSSIQDSYDNVYNSYVEERYNSLDFPDPSQYVGQKGVNCTTPMSDHDFNYYLNRLPLERDEHLRLEYLKKQVTTYCFSTAQIMKLGLELNLEKDRLNLLKFSSDKCYDMGNFVKSTQIITHTFYKDDLLNHISSHHYLIQPTIIECEVSEDKFKHVLQSIRAQSFPNEMKAMSKKYIEKECFSMEQLKEICTLFSFDDDKLEIIKFLIDYAPYPDELHMFRDLFRFNSSQKKFDALLLNH